MGILRDEILRAALQMLQSILKKSWVHNQPVPVEPPEDFSAVTLSAEAQRMRCDGAAPEERQAPPPAPVPLRGSARDRARRMQ